MVGHGKGRKEAKKGTREKREDIGKTKRTWTTQGGSLERRKGSKGG